MKKRWSASTAILLLVAGILASFLIVDIIVFERHVSLYRNSVVNDNIKLLNLAEQYQINIMDDANKLLNTLASTSLLLDDNPEEISKFFEILDKNQSNYSSFSIFTPDGNTLASIYKGRNFGSKPVEIILQRKYFKDALATKSFAVGQYSTTLGLAHLSSLPVSLPVYDEYNNPKYVIMVTIDIDKVAQFYSYLAKKNDINIQIYDSNKTLIFTTNENNRHLIGSTTKLEYIANMINSNSNLLWEKIANADGSEQISTRKILKLQNSDKPYLYFFVESSIYSNWDLIKNYHTFEIFGILFILLVSATLAGCTGYYYFSYGLDQLIHVATSAQNGNINARNGYIRGCRELQILGKAFDIMLTNVVSSATHMHEQKARLDFALNGAQVATWEWDTLNKKYLLDRRGISLLGYNNYSENTIDLGTLMQKYDLQQAQITMDLHVEDKIPNFEYEVKLMHQNGSQIWFVLQGRKEITTVTLSVQCIFGICIDITQRKKLERFEIERAEYFKRLSNKDALTGLSNRRHFIEQAQIMVQHSLRHSHSFSLGMLDLDFFKKINDTYGHLTGDNVLKALSKLLTDTVRKTDIVGRYGGEEFIFILPETDQDKAISAAEKLRKSIMNLVVRVNSEEITFTASIGVCTYIPESTNISTNEQVSSIIVDITSSADSNLYTAKDSGRNKVVSTVFQLAEPKNS